jgi:CRISPR-associated protein Csa3
MDTIHIIPVGFSKEKLIESLKRYPFQKVYLLLGKSEHLEGEDRARKTAKSMKNDLKAIAEVREFYVDKEDVFEAARELIRVINAEKSRGNRVMVNVSGSMRTLGIACYLAASMTGAEVYSGISKYDEKGKSIGIDRTIEIPTFPIKRISREKENILDALYKSDGEVESLEDLISILKPSLKPGSKDFRAERSRVSYLVNALKEDGFVEAKKSGKTLRVRLSKTGEIYVIGKISPEKVIHEVVVQ